ncbi:hypothetical protein [Dactylosporangium sp. NPDC000521]|uniref:hypothetical protein n=1 Tax=Dactylosporangium sp. NPDC000521 TaxID=3363975 RepID=UPI0036BE2F69
MQPPFTFRPGGARPGPATGHMYTVIYVTESVARNLKPGEDATLAYDTAHDISLTVIA